MFRYRDRKRCFELCLQWKRGVHRNHYDSLELSSKASQADIKKAYYKLSMKFHPDKPEGSETKFREITAAYEVLGNLKLRRLYDQGIFRDTRGHAHAAPNAADIPHDTRMKARSHTPATGKTNVYDFDEWSRMHYSKTARKDFAKQDMMQKKRVLREQRAKEEEGWFYILCMAVLVTSIPIFLMSDPDRPSKRKPPDER